MGFVGQIKARLAMMNMQPSTSRSKQVMGLRRAKKIGIIYEGTDRDIFEVIRNLIQEMRDSQKDVRSLGFMNVKHEEELPKSKLGMDFFGPKSLNFSLKSSDSTVINFLSEKFDILIDLNIDENPILLQLTAGSNASFIIGNGDVGKKFRDLYFESPSENQPQIGRDFKIKQLQTLIDNIKKYATEL